jgi:hypothetical protein
VPQTDDLATYRSLAITSPEGFAPHLAAWETLEGHALEDNLYFSGPFLAAVFRHLERRRPSAVVLVYRDAAGASDLVGAAAFEVLPPTPRCPLPVLATAAGPHGYHAFPLLHREFAREAFRALWDWVERPGVPWRLALLRHVHAASPAQETVRAELDRRRRPHAVKVVERRPVLNRGLTFEEYLASLPSSRRKHYHRCWRRLAERGPVEVVLHQDLADDGVADRFLDVERAGWKGEEGSALGSRADDKAFFQEITREFGKRGRLFFVELRLAGRPVAMTSNFVNEIQGVRLFQEAANLRLADSGTNDQSFVSAWWRDAVELRSLYVAGPSLGAQAFVHLFPQLSRMKAVLARRRNATVSSHS